MRLPFVVIRYGVWVGFHVNKWSYGSRSSWRHGNAYLGWIKIVW